MKIKSFTLYKSTLDRFYNNVIDADKENTLNDSSYKELIDSHYSPMVIYNTNDDIKAVVENNGIVSISIAKMYEDVITGGYNYCCINTGKKNIFYFVIGCRSLNDGKNPSMLITLERDSWANNIEVLTNHNETDLQQVIRTHFERWYDDSNTRLLYPYYRTSGDICNFRSENEITTESIHNENVGIIWCGFRVSAGANVEGSTVAAILDKPWMHGFFGGAPLEASSMPFYFPLFAYTIDVNGVPSIDGRITFNSNYVAPGTNEITTKTVSYDYLNQSDNGNNLQLGLSLYFAGEWCDEAFLTTIPPFQYTVAGSLGDVTVIVNDAVSTDGYIGSKNIKSFDKESYNYYGDIVGVKKQMYVVCVRGNDINSGYTKYISVTSPLDGFSANSQIGSKLFDPYASKYETLYYEPRIYCEPFKQVNIRVGDIKQQIDIHETGTVIKLNYHTGLRSEPTCNIFVNDKPITENTGMGTLGSLPTFKVNGTTGSNLGLTMLGGIVKAGVQFAVTKDIIGSTATAARDIAASTLANRNNLSSAVLDIKSEKGGLFDVIQDKNPDYSLQYAFNSVQDYRTDMERYAQDYDLDLKRTHYKQKLDTEKAYGGLIEKQADIAINTVQQLPQIYGGGITSKSVSNLASNNYTYYNPVVAVTQWADNGDIEGVLNDMYMYGYKRNVGQSIKHQTRFWFDFVQTSNCSLPFIKNFMDRNILEQAFNRGVNKWYYGPLGIHSTFEKNINNPERKYIRTEDAQIYFDFTKDMPERNLGTLGNVITFDNQLNINKNGLIINNNSYKTNQTMTDLGITMGNGKSCTVAFKLSSFTPQTGERYLYTNLTTPITFRLFTAGVNANNIGTRFSAASSSNYLALTLPNGQEEDLVNKTITLSYYYDTPTSIIVKLFVNGVEVNNIRKDFINRPFPISQWEIGSTASWNCVMSKLKVWYDDGEWDETKASSHLL